jgi:hypothetical protein
MIHTQVLTKSSHAQKALDKVSAVDVDAIFAEREGEYGLAGAFGHLHACYQEAVRQLGMVVRDLVSTEATLEAIRYAAEKVFDERDPTTDEAPYERLYTAADAVLKMIEAGWSHERIMAYELKDEEIDEGRVIPKSEYCIQCGDYKRKEAEKGDPLCDLCQDELVRVR